MKVVQGWPPAPPQSAISPIRNACRACHRDQRRRIDVNRRPAGMRTMLIDATGRRAYERDLIEARERAQTAVIDLRKNAALLQAANEALERRVEERTSELSDIRDCTRLALSAVDGVGVWTFGFFCDSCIAKLYGRDRENAG